MRYRDPERDVAGEWLETCLYVQSLYGGISGELLRCAVQEGDSGALSALHDALLWEGHNWYADALVRAVLTDYPHMKAPGGFDRVTNDV